MLSSRVSRGRQRSAPSFRARPSDGADDSSHTQGQIRSRARLKRYERAPIPVWTPETSPLLEACQRAGLRLTKRRQALLAVLEQAEAPICVEVYCERLEALGLPTARSTIYRLILDLLAAGLVTETLCRDRRRYEVAPPR